jgi:hypothetical protein
MDNKKEYEAPECEILVFGAAYTSAVDDSWSELIDPDPT